MEKGVAVHTEMSREREWGVWAGQCGRCGGQDQTFPVACATTIRESKRQREREEERKEGNHVRIILGTQNLNSAVL